MKVNTSLAILMATFNGQKYILEQLDSLMSQTYRDFTLVVHDDGSSDGTLDLIEDYVRQTGLGGSIVDSSHSEPFPRICILPGPSCGSAKENFLWMLSQVEADLYMFCDQDDVWLPNKIERSIEVYEELLSIGDRGADSYNCIFTDMYVTDSELSVIDKSFIRSIDRAIDNIKPGQIIVDNPAAGCTMLFGRGLRDVIVDALPSIDVNKIEMHDGFVLATASLLGKVRGIDEPLSYYRQHDDNEMGAISESTGQKIRRNLFELITGRSIAKKREFIQGHRDMAGQLAIVLSVFQDALSQQERLHYQTESNIAWLKMLSTMSDRDSVGNYVSRRQRVLFYKEHNIERGSAKATRWMYRWI